MATVQIFPISSSIVEIGQEEEEEELEEETTSDSRMSDDNTYGEGDDDQE